MKRLLRGLFTAGLVMAIVLHLAAVADMAGGMHALARMLPVAAVAGGAGFLTGMLPAAALAVMGVLLLLFMGAVAAAAFACRRQSSWEGFLARRELMQEAFAYSPGTQQAIGACAVWLTAVILLGNWHQCDVHTALMTGFLLFNLLMANAVVRYLTGA